MLLELCIKAGWWTVPLKGELKRLPNGKKTVPFFETGWKKKYSEQFNEEITDIACVLTGMKSNILAIDCDNQVTYDLFKSLDPNNFCHFVSKGKPEGGGTILYKYNSAVGTFRLVTDHIKLDFFADDGCVYLPTEANETKESWEGITELPEIPEMPDIVLATLSTFKSKVLDNTLAKTSVIKTSISNRLAPLLVSFVDKKEYDPALFRILTPYSFRDLPLYISQGHLHPKDVPAGRGSEYLSKISAILGSDISVNMELYTKAIMLINSLKATPKDKHELMATIINPMLEERATIDGQVIWQYDEHWEKMGFIATSINGDYLESFFDDVKGIYYLVNYSVPYIRAYGEKRGLINTMRAMLGRAISEQQYDSVKRIIRTTLNPALEFGHLNGTDRYNLFRQTQELAILNNPASYATSYVRPNTIIKYFESLIPDDTMRMFVLSFIKTKLSTFKYSPIILYLIGKPGSGKDTMVNIIRKIIGDEYVAKPDTKVFLEQYNGWMLDKFFVHLDEYGNKLNRASDKQEVLGKLKAYTGSEEMQVRAMRSDGFNYKHRITFIISANTNPLPVEMDDRRVAFIKTPNKLETQDWVKLQGGISAVQDRIKEEIKDFCYYLGTDIPLLKFDDYVIAPVNEDKERLMLDSLPAAEQMSYYFQHNQFDTIRELAEEYAISNIDMSWERNRFESEKVEELYLAMTDGAGATRTIIRSLKNAGIQRSHSTRLGQNTFYYYVPELHRFKGSGKLDTTETEFKPTEAVTSIKGLE